LNAMLHEEIFIWIDPKSAKIIRSIIPNASQYVDNKGRMVARVKKALYRLIQSAKLWHETLVKVLTEDDFIANLIDQCVMNKTVGGAQITIVIYVDDLLICSVNKNIEAIKQWIEEKFQETKIKNHVPRNVLQRQQNGSIFLSMKEYIELTLNEYPNKLKEYVSPTKDDIFYPEDTKLEEEKKKLFH